MQNIDSPKALSNHQPCNTQAVVEPLLRQRLYDNMAPFALEVDCPGLIQWAHAWAQPSFCHQLLVREVRTWSEYLTHKPLTLSFFIEPFTLLDAPQLTELVYAIGRNLTLVHGHHVDHGATLRAQDLTRQNLALLRGLEFNHVCIKIAEDFELEKLRAFKQMLIDYKFTFCSLELDFGSTDDEFLFRLMALLTHVEPSSLRFTPSSGSFWQHIEHNEVTKALMDRGYFLSESESILKFHSLLNRSPQDILRLGPGRKSRFNNLHITNLIEPDHYCARLEKNQQPIATCW